MSKMGDIKLMIEGMYPEKKNDLEHEFSRFLKGIVHKTDLSPELVDVLNTTLGTETWKKLGIKT